MSNSPQQVEALGFESIRTAAGSGFQRAELAVEAGIVAAIQSFKNGLGAARGGRNISLHVNLSSVGAAHFPVSRLVSGGHWILTEENGAQGEGWHSARQSSTA